MSTRNTRFGTHSIALAAILTIAGCDPLGDGRGDGRSSTDDGAHSEFFGTDDFGITVHPDAAEFEDLTSVVDAFHADLHPDIVAGLDHATPDQLRSILSWTYIDDVVEYAGEDPQEMGVEYTVGLIDVPYEDMIAVVPPDQWGLNLDHYLGGELLPMEGVEGGQYERMVLAALPCDIDMDLVNNDMTKAEIVRVKSDRAEVYWRVYHSDNDSTASDVGSVVFERYDDSSTLVVFHSAHVIRGLGGYIDLVPSGIWGVEDAMLGAVSDMFVDFVANYRDLAEAGAGGSSSAGENVQETGTVDEGEWHDFGPFTVDDGQALLAAMKGTGDADLYVNIGDLADLDDYDCRPYVDGSDETCEVDGPGEMYVSVYGYGKSSEYSLEISW